MVDSTLANLVEPGRKICYGIVQPGAETTGGIPILRVNNFGPNGLSTSDVLSISPAVEQAFPRSRLRGGELLVTLVGSIGQCTIAPPTVAGWNVARAVGVVPILDPMLAKWASYVIRSADAQRFFDQRANTTVQTTLNLRDLALLPVPLLPRAELEAVIAVLSAIDDKIELNRRMNETLEAQARALFRDWFVDFGPVKAKLAGAAPYLAPDLWSLFPDRLDDDGVPEGWVICQIRHALNLAYGKSLPARDRRPGKVPVYGSGGASGTHEKALIEGPAVIVGRKGTVGSIYYEPHVSFPIDTVFYVEPKLPLLFCYHLLSSFPLGEMNTDAAVPGLNRGNVYRLEFPMPPGRLVSDFATIATGLRDKIDANDTESRALAQTRDLLLPKLMSGEIGVGDFAEETALVA